MLVFDIDKNCKSGCTEQEQRRLIMRQFDLFLHPILWFTVISDLLLQNDRDVIQGFSKVDNLIIVSIYQSEKSLTFDRMSAGINSDTSVDPYGSVIETIR